MPTIYDNAIVTTSIYSDNSLYDPGWLTTTGGTVTAQRGVVYQIAYDVGSGALDAWTKMQRERERARLDRLVRERDTVELWRRL